MQTDDLLLQNLTAWAEAADPSRKAKAAILSRRSDRMLLRVATLVAKAHADGTDENDLNARLHILSQGSLPSIFLQPIRKEAVRLGCGRLGTLWPAGEALVNDLEGAPWTAAAQLLAELHRCPWPIAMSWARFPKSRAMQKVTNALLQLDDRPADAYTRIVQRAGESLILSDEPLLSPTLVHGDWHFGQLVSITRDGKKVWRLIDIDDMGLGNPAWDLARPAAFFAAGILAPGLWEEFLEAYRTAGGPGVPSQGNPWIALDRPARALVVQCAASALWRAKLEERALNDAELPLIEACRQISRVPAWA